MTREGGGGDCAISCLFGQLVSMGLWTYTYGGALLEQLKQLKIEITNLGQTPPPTPPSPTQSTPIGKIGGWGGGGGVSMFQEERVKVIKEEKHSDK